MKFTLLATLLASAQSIALERAFDEYIDSKYVSGPNFPNDPNARAAIAAEKERMHYRNVPSIYQPVDVQVSADENV